MVLILSGAHFLKTKLGGADLTGARVYGVNCWDVEVSDDTIQLDLVVTQARDPRFRWMTFAWRSSSI